MKKHTGPFTDDIAPDAVRRLLDELGRDRILVVVLDEFDKVAEENARSMLSDTLKFLSDRAVPATVILVGVSDDVESLVNNHRSLERCLRQIYMQRMSFDELQLIVKKPLAEVGMTIEDDAIDDIIVLSKGLPHYTHLLGLQSGRAALDRFSLAVKPQDVQVSLQSAIEKAQASIQNDYMLATTTSRKEALYKQVLLACALAQTDELGWFYPKDVRPPLEKILAREYKIEAFGRHMGAFSDNMRGPVLVVDKQHARPRYRFENPLMQPYVMMRGIAEGMIARSAIMSDEERGRLREARMSPRQKGLFE